MTMTYNDKTSPGSTSILNPAKFIVLEFIASIYQSNTPGLFANMEGQKT